MPKNEWPPVFVVATETDDNKIIGSVLDLDEARAMAIEACVTQASAVIIARCEWNDGCHEIERYEPK